MSHNPLAEVRVTARQRVAGTLVILSSLVVPGLSAQGGPQAWIAADTIPLYKTGLGTFTRPIASKVPGAQAYFDQGLQMMFSFAKREAVQSFRAAWKLDPDCAICFWGEAWAWGSRS